VEGFYRPFLLLVNVIYVLVRWWMLDGRIIGSFEHGLTSAIPGIVALTTLFGLQYFAYIGILDDAANDTKKKKNRLAGGASLDLLGLVVLIQFGSVLLTAKFYYLLLILPCWAAWFLKKTFWSSNDSKNSNQVSEEGADNAAGENEQQDEKRRKRADRRRQKWS
jgi:UPF0716 family protein affecting phage T7 exclusion